MAPNQPAPIAVSDARTTYRYLRIGLVLAVVLLTTSILIEHGKADDCWQTSISAYYYTPVRAIFVGGMIAVGFGLIVIKGKSDAEDVFLNIAGMLAPIVAVAPTAEGGVCLPFGAPKPPRTEAFAGVPDAVIANINNNFKALLIVGFLGLGLAVVLPLVINRGLKAPFDALRRGTRISLAITAGALLVGWWAFARWDEFYTRAHGFAAVAMFVALIGAVACKAIEHRGSVYSSIYGAIGVLMAGGGLAINFIPLGGEHTTFVLEAYEIALFAVFWIVQTRQNWYEDVTTSPGDTAWPWQVAHEAG